MTSQLSDAGFSATAELTGNGVLKIGETTSVVISMTVMRDDGSPIAQARDVIVTSAGNADASVEGGTDLFTYPGEASAKPITVTVSVTANGDGNVTLTLGTRD